jgi:hypothetical protein
MTSADLIRALGFPTSAHVNRRVPKKLLVENGAHTAADKRQINGGIEALFWVAAIKPATVGVREYRDKSCEYLEIDVLSLSLRGEAGAARLVELVHRAVPYPLLLITERPGQMGISTGHKRWAESGVGKTVIDGHLVSAAWSIGQEPEHLPAFCEALSIARQPHDSMRALYQGWVDTIVALNAALLTGSFRVMPDPIQAAARGEALREYACLDAQVSRARATARKE